LKRFSFEISKSWKTGGRLFGDHIAVLPGGHHAEEEGVEYTREEWEAALDKAKQRMEPGEEENWPLIITDDFY
jgi:hypothetical protein